MEGAVLAPLERALDVRGLVGVGKEENVSTIKDAASEFLTSKRVAVTGVSREPQNHGSNVVAWHTEY